MKDLVTHLFTKYLLRTYCVLGSEQTARYEDTAMNKKNTILPSWRAPSPPAFLMLKQHKGLLLMGKKKTQQILADSQC